MKFSIICINVSTLLAFAIIAIATIDTDVMMYHYTRESKSGLQKCLMIMVMHEDC
ncbi:MAG TPA: hypothetical protein VFY64_04825 [Nitrososphaeraceae archaeon]|nr:hypothetical protein [Nitrososphaeraceae archaeon]